MESEKVVCSVSKGVVKGETGWDLLSSGLVRCLAGERDVEGVDLLLTIQRALVLKILAIVSKESLQDVARSLGSASLHFEICQVKGTARPLTG